MATNKSLKTILASIDSKYNADQLDKVNEQLDAELSNDRKKTSKSIKNLYNPNTNEFVTPPERTSEDLKKIYQEGMRKKGGYEEFKDETGKVTGSGYNFLNTLTGNLKKDHAAASLFMKHVGNEQLKDEFLKSVGGTEDTRAAQAILGFNPKQGKVKVSDELSKLYSSRGFGDEILDAQRGKYTGGIGHRSDVDYFQGDKPYFSPMTRGYQGTTRVDWGRLGYDNNPTTGDELRNELFSSRGYLAKEAAKKKAGKNYGTSKQM